MKPRVIVICGPTAGGKTSLAIRLAGDKPASIISADSRQAYKDLDVLTGKDIPKESEKSLSSLSFNSSPVPFYEKGNLRFWGYDLLNPTDQYNASDFVEVTSKIISSELENKRQVFVVGGTGFYLKALTDPASLSAVPPSSPLRKELEELTLEELQTILQKENSGRFNSLNESDVKNPRRLIRAIEVGRSPLSPGKVRPPEIDYVWVGLRLSPKTQEENVQKRVSDRLKSGAIEEVVHLLETTPNRNLPIYTTLGIKPIMEYLEGKLGLDQLEKRWLTDEVNYSKRQLTWFKKQDQIIWYDQGEAAKLTLPILYENQ